MQSLERARICHLPGPGLPICANSYRLILSCSRGLVVGVAGTKPGLLRTRAKGPALVGDQLVDLLGKAKQFNASGLMQTKHTCMPHARQSPLQSPRRCISPRARTSAENRPSGTTALPGPVTRQIASRLSLAGGTRPGRPSGSKNCGHGPAKTRPRSGCGGRGFGGFLAGGVVLSLEKKAHSPSSGRMSTTSVINRSTVHTNPAPQPQLRSKPLSLLR